MFPYVIGPIVIVSVSAIGIYLNNVMNFHLKNDLFHRIISATVFLRNYYLTE